jgi:5-methylcytosine-specific restriction endonuclease McrA
LTYLACAGCGDVRPPGRRGPKPRSLYCRKCAEEIRIFRRKTSRWTARECQNCNVWFSSAKQKFCSDECRRTYYTKLNTEKQKVFVPLSVRQCSRCYQDFLTYASRTQKFCSDRCKRLFDYELIPAKRRGAPRVATASVSYKVLQESGWECAVCGVATPESLRGTVEPNAPEVDHIFPVSRGGSHEIGNLQCLCRKCNMSKGAKLMSEWRPANDNFRCVEVAA